VATVRFISDEVLIQLRIKSDDLDGPTLAELAQLLIATLEILAIIFMAFARVIMAITHLLDWSVEVLPCLPARWGLALVRFTPPMG